MVKKGGGGLVRERERERKRKKERHRVGFCQMVLPPTVEENMNVIASRVVGLHAKVQSQT